MRIFLASALVIFLFACNNADKKETTSMAGAYKMLWQSIKSDSTDTTYRSLQQLKIFTGDLMMFANVNPADSVSSFGIGDYSINADTIMEHVTYNASDTSKNETAATYKLVIEKTDKGYKQIIPDIESGGQHFILTEEYENAGASATSPLDGLWKLTKAVQVKGKDTTLQEITQYKAIYAGQVIWGHTYKDSLNKIHTGIGFGKFEMSGDNKAKESMLSSTYYQVRGQDFDLGIEMKGTDEFTQSITEKDGTKGIETYQRVKKQ